MIYTRHITLDLYDDRITEVEAQQGDTARALEITVTADGEQVIPAGGTRVNFRGCKPDGNGIDNPATITEQNTIRYQFTEQTVAVAGRFPCDIYFVQTDGTLSTVTFWLIVKPHPDGKPGSSSYEYGSLVDATNKALTATGRANDAAKLIKNMTVSASKVAAGGTPTAKLTKQDDHYALALGLVTGDKGDKGDAATVKVGKVTTGDPGSSASVKNSGTSSDATLDFVIPQGPIGPAGGVDSVNGEVGDIQIGGSNLLTGTKDFDGFSFGSYSKNPNETYRNFTTVLSSSSLYNGPKKTIALDPGTYTFSVFARVAGDVVDNNAQIFIPEGGLDDENLSISHQSKTVTNSWERYSLTFDVMNSQVSCSPRIELIKKGTTLQVCGYSLERGNTIMDWSPAPEDIPSMAPVQSVNGAHGNVVIGGTNLLTNSLDPHAIGYDGSTVNKTLNVAVSEWGATDAIRIRGRSGTSNLAAIINSLDGSGQSRPFNRYSEYCISTFIRNDGTSPVTVGRESFTATIQAGESKHVSISCPAPGSLATQIQIQIRTQETDTPYDVVIWHPKIEFGTVATEWSPAPEDYLGPFNIYDVPEMHRNIYRGKNLGDHVTEAQKAAIAAGTWDDLYLGDYWTINGHTWRIADFDYWLGKGDTSCKKHHIVVVPDVSLYTAQMHNTESGAYEAGATANTTAGGYYNSDMRTTNLARAKTLIEADFGTGSILNHRIMLTNAVKDGYPSGGGWFDSEVDLMNEMMVYGAYHFAPKGNGTIIPYNYTTEYTQLALFQAVPYYITPNRSWYWLRDVVSAKFFAAVTAGGDSNYGSASDVSGVRPAVGIVGS